MKKLLLLLIIPFLCFGQGWEQVLGTAGVVTSVQQTSDGGYILCGTSTDEQVILLKTTPLGNEQWIRYYYDGSTGYKGICAKQTTDGGYIVIGHLNNGAMLYMLKTDQNGQDVWLKTISIQYSVLPSSIQQTSDGGYIICGYGQYALEGVCADYKIYLIKTDENGEEEWIETFAEDASCQSRDRAYSVQQTADGGYIMCGSVMENVIFPKAPYLIKTGAMGNKEWSQTFMDQKNYLEDSEFFSIQQTADGGYIMCGYRYNPGYGRDVYLVKTDDIGVETWSQNFGGINSDVGYSVQQTSDGGYIVSGSREYLSDSSDDVYLIKTDSGGNEEWSQTFGGTMDDVGYSVEQTSDDGYVVAGSICSNLEEDSYYLPFENCNSPSNIYLIKTNSEGNINTTSILNPNDVTWLDPNWENFDWELYWDDLDLGVVVDWDNLPWSSIIASNVLPEDLIYYIIFQNMTTEEMPFVWGEFIEFINTTNISEALIGKDLLKKIDVLGRTTNNNESFQLHIYDDGSVEKKYLIK